MRNSSRRFIQIGDKNGAASIGGGQSENLYFMADFLLYGAYGYTGKIICAAAEKFQLTPLLAGRRAEPLRALNQQYGYDYRVIDLADTTALEAALREVPLVLHAAGPFVHTAAPMQAACLRTGTHYLDITGEIDVFEHAHTLDAQARAAGITLLPGAGFDVVPTDCMAAYLHRLMPEAVQLQLAFGSAGGRPSRGTTLTMVENLGQPGAVRRDGRIVPVPVGHQTLQVDFPHKSLHCVSIPWGDVATAYYTTGIPNIETYMALPPSAMTGIRLTRLLGPLLRTGWVRRFLERRVKAAPAGLDAAARARAASYVWGCVYDASGRWTSATLTLPETYDLTAQTSLLLIRKVLDGEAAAGFQTPAGAFGPDLILEVAGTTRHAPRSSGSA